MSRKALKILISSLVISVGGLFCGSSVWAQNNNLIVEFEATPLFSEANFLPGEGATRWVKVTNNYEEAKDVGIEASNVFGAAGLATQLDFRISQGGSDLYGGTAGAKTLADFFNEGEIYLSTLEPGLEIQYDITVTFRPESGNEHQGTETGFDFNIGIFAGETISGEEGAPGAAGGVIYIPPIPTAVREISNVLPEIVAPTSATITWNTDIPSYAAVIYDTESHPVLGDPPRYGYAWRAEEEGDKSSSHSISLSDLLEGTDYYYRVVSWASPINISKEYTFTTLALEEEILEEEEKGPEGEEEISPEEGYREEVVGEEEEKEVREEEVSLEEKTEGRVITLREEERKEEGLELPPEREEGILEEGEEGVEEEERFRFLAAMSTALTNLKSALPFVLLVLVAYTLYWFYIKKKREEKK